MLIKTEESMNDPESEILVTEEADKMNSTEMLDENVKNKESPIITLYLKPN
jgi:hypothetical protein